MADATSTLLQDESTRAWLEVAVKALTSADGAERHAVAGRCRALAGTPAFTLVVDRLVGIVGRGSARAPATAHTLLLLGDPVLAPLLHHIASSLTPNVRVRLLELLAGMAPATDPSQRLAFETTLLALAHTERDEAVQRAFAPALFQHVPSVSVAARLAAEERLRSGSEEGSTFDESDRSEHV
jgi:hypothetical protein